MKLVGASLLAALVLAGCVHKSEPTVHRTDAVLYTIGLSTDPYGNSAPQGFGVATGLLNGEFERVEIHGRGLGGFGGAEWLDSGRVLVPKPAPPLRRPTIYRFDGELQRESDAPVPGGAGFAWSPTLKLLVYEPSVPCDRGQRSLYRCYRASGNLFVTRVDGSGRHRIGSGHLMGWTADRRVAFFRNYQRATPEAIDPDGRRVGPILPGWKLELPIWSADRRFVAAIGDQGVVLARADGTPVQTIRSRLVISMIAWSPVADRLVFTTSGFPDPHQLFVVDEPDAHPRVLYDSGYDHFDWVTWSPNGRWLLLDEANRHRWSLLRSDRPGLRRTMQRLGGRPMWCCPVNAFSASGTTRNP